MGELGAKRNRVTRHELRHDRHTVSLLTDYLVFSPKYSGKVLEGEMVERYMQGQKGYEKADTVSVIEEEKEKTHKIWYNTLYNKLFGGKYQKF